MAKVIMICGRICCGKSTYAEKLRTENKAVVLSVDEIMLALFGGNCGERHYEYTEKIKTYLLNKSVEIVSSGTDAILDWGFWTKAERERTKQFYREHDVDCELHYICVSDDEWRRCIEKRNNAVMAGNAAAYYVDSKLKEKVSGIFEPPDVSEIDYIKENP